MDVTLARILEIILAVVAGDFFYYMLLGIRRAVKKFPYKITWSDNTGTYVMYEHHGRYVWTDIKTKGKHRDMCLCFKCGKFFPNDPKNCPMAQSLYEHDVKYNQTTPVFECPEFEPAGTIVKPEEKK